MKTCILLTVFFIFSSGRHDNYRHHNMNTINNNFGNPRLPPFPHPTTISPLVQIKHGLNIPGLGGASTTGKSKGKPHGKPQAVLGDVICVTACFAPSRGWIAGSPTLSRDKQGTKIFLYLCSTRARNSLFLRDSKLLLPDRKAGSKTSFGVANFVHRKLELASNWNDFQWLVTWHFMHLFLISWYNIMHDMTAQKLDLVRSWKRE